MRSLLSRLPTFRQLRQPTNLLLPSALTRVQSPPAGHMSACRAVCHRIWRKVKRDKRPIDLPRTSHSTHARLPTIMSTYPRTMAVRCGDAVARDEMVLPTSNVWTCLRAQRSFATMNEKLERAKVSQRRMSKERIQRSVLQMIDENPDMFPTAHSKSSSALQKSQRRQELNGDRDKATTSQERYPSTEETGKPMASQKWPTERGPRERDSGLPAKLMQNRDAPIVRLMKLQPMPAAEPYKPITFKPRVQVPGASLEDETQNRAHDIEKHLSNMQHPQSSMVRLMHMTSDMPSPSMERLKVPEFVADQYELPNFRAASFEALTKSNERPRVPNVRLVKEKSLDSIQLPEFDVPETSTERIRIPNVRLMKEKSVASFLENPSASSERIPAAKVRKLKETPKMTMFQLYEGHSEKPAQLHELPKVPVFRLVNETPKLASFQVVDDRQRYMGTPAESVTEKHKKFNERAKVPELRLFHMDEPEASPKARVPKSKLDGDSGYRQSEAILQPLMYKHTLRQKLPAPKLPCLKPTNQLQHGAETFETRLKESRIAQPLQLKVHSSAHSGNLNMTQQYRRKLPTTPLVKSPVFGLAKQYGARPSYGESADHKMFQSTATARKVHWTPKRTPK